MQLADMIKSGDEGKVIVAAFPLEDTSKTLADIFPPSWINKEEQTVIPLLLVPDHLVKEICQHMLDQGNEYLRSWYASHPEAGRDFSATASSETEG